MELDQLKIRLKTWEYEFQSKNERPPTKDDIKRLPEIKEMYKEYQALKKQDATATQARKLVVTPSKNNASPKKSTVTKTNELQGVELGPTPQIYGKAISIFEMKLSPVKKALDFGEVDEMPSSQIFDTLENDTKRQLEFPMNTPNSSPFKKPKPIQSKYYGPNSPLKLEEENITVSIKNESPLKRTPQKNTDSNSDPISFSPSPLVKRPLTKSLLELAKEHKTFLQEFEQKDSQEDLVSQETDGSSSDNQDDDDEEHTEEDKGRRGKRRKTLRRLTNNEQSKMVPKDISKELLKLKTRQVNEFLGKEAAEETEDEEEGRANDRETTDIGQKATTRPKQRKRPGKYNLVSNNFRRLKLPRKHSGNRHWPKRR